VQRDYPVHWTHFVHSAEELVPQRTRHPVFAGSYDWHSCVPPDLADRRLLRLRPDLPDAGTAAAVLDRLVTVEGAATEAEFFRGPAGAHWERPYGWAWLLVLDAELRGWVARDPATNAAADWAKNLSPLTDALRERWLGWLADADLPTRVGTHTNSAFALGLVLDAARVCADDDLASVTASAARRWFAGDRDYGAYEPDAATSSPRAGRGRPAAPRAGTSEFATWFDAFLPDLATDRWVTLREPIPVPDPTDPYGSHRPAWRCPAPGRGPRSRRHCRPGTGTSNWLGRRPTCIGRRAGGTCSVMATRPNTGWARSRRTWTWARSLVDPAGQREQLVHHPLLSAVAQRLNRGGRGDHPAPGI